MTDLTVANVRSVVTMSSREIAVLTGKRHANVVRDIEKMLLELEVSQLKFESAYIDEQGKRRKEYQLPYRECEILITGYDVKRRAAVIDRWTALESGESLPAKSNSGLPEYRRARTLKMSVEAVTSLFDLMPHLSPEARQCAAANIINPVAGFEAIPLPKLQEHYYSAGEVGEMLGVSANKVGRLANAHDLKTDQHGMFVMDKSKHSVKQVEAFRYNAAGVEALRSILSGDVAA
ncbi:Rha family transcriptional regulator [Serratia proteamaculans]|uniref:Rha family transcriptional regulator n=1 Tax=Serratia proteamaculans TaxID=28151 RepID=A0A7U0N3L9_SERPR|nr:Rha family transcriptional regulator [Serratia proteamaculans]MBO1505234.1 Rha family transcriptional regulator [Serratia proteamaculans]QQX51818.1 Rha family transcriptional regulator [Serratia proteamaculans]